MAVGVAAVGAFALDQPDVRLYHHWGSALLHGSVSRGMPSVYPAMAAILFALVAALPWSYAFCFAVLMAALLALLVRFVFRLEGLRAGLPLLTYLILGVSGVLFARYDLVPATLAFAAVVWARDQRYGRAWAAAALGASLKLFPALLLPGFFLHEWRRTGRAPWRRAPAVVLAWGGLAVIQIILAPGTLLQPFRSQAGRGFEFSSFGGTVMFVAAAGHPRWQFAFGQWQLMGGQSRWLAPLLAACEVSGALAVWWLLYRRRLTLESASLAVLTVAVMGNRSLAPQYLIWLIPLWALWAFNPAWLLCCLLTAATFPLAPTLFTAALFGALRNVVLLVGFALWLRAELRPKPTAELLSGREFRQGGCVSFSPAFDKGQMEEGGEVRRLDVGLNSRVKGLCTTLRAGDIISARPTVTAGEE